MNLASWASLLLFQLTLCGVILLLEVAACCRLAIVDELLDLLLEAVVLFVVDFVCPQAISNKLKSVIGTTSRHLLLILLNDVIIIPPKKISIL